MSSNAATILSRKLFEVAGKASVLNCLTDPKRQADFDPNRNLFVKAYCPNWQIKLLKKNDSHETPAGRKDKLNKTAPELIASRSGCWNVDFGPLSVLRKIEIWSGAM